MIAALAIALWASTATAQIAPPEGARPVRASRVTDCAEHGVWHAPDGWTVSTTPELTIAIAPGGTAALVRARVRPRLRDDAAFSAAVARVIARIAGVSAALGAVTGIDRSRWRRERSVEGTAGPYAVIGRAVRTEAIWVGLHAPGDAAARAALDAAITGWLMLTSHACACGYDCDRPPTR